MGCLVSVVRMALWSAMVLWFAMALWFAMLLLVRDGSVSLRWFCRLPASDLAAPSMAGVPA
jgi:hypothetical protein